VHRPRYQPYTPEVGKLMTYAIWEVVQHGLR
jgi:hypothetical protein